MEKQKANRQVPNSSEIEVVGSGQKHNRKPIGVFKLPANHDSAQPIYKNEVTFDMLEIAVASNFSSTIANRVPINKWMAFERSEPNDKPNNTNPTCNFDDPVGKFSSKSHIEAKQAERTAEWGLVVKKDVEEGGFKAIGGTMARKSTGDGVDSRAFEGGFQSVSQELKDALETLQQTFVISDATKPDCPIMYASSGFFNMTGYSSNEIIGRNWLCNCYQSLGSPVVGFL